MSIQPAIVGQKSPSSKGLAAASNVELAAASDFEDEQPNEERSELLDGVEADAAASQPPAATKPKALGEQLVPLLGVPIKWFALAFLVLQNSGASLLMRWSRIAPGEHDWDPQVGVIMQEFIKGITCIVLVHLEEGLGVIVKDKRGFLLTGIPAAIYLVQNNMQYVAITHLSAPVYAVLYQTKILSTGILSVLVLGKVLTGFQWLALAALTLGVALVTLSQMGSSHKGGEGGGFIIGISAVLLAATTSGLAGVSFEKILKDSHVSLWARNLQMAAYSIVIGFVGLLMQGKASQISEQGIFHGFTMAAWISVINNAAGGMLIAVVVKYADNIMKNFSQGLSVILTTIMSCIVFECGINATFAAGVALVIYSVVLYGNVIKPLPEAIMSKLGG